jgi:GNAT superfamily N-acetyltransferase
MQLDHRAPQGTGGGSVTAGELRPADSAAALALRNRVFPPVGPGHWEDNETAAVAHLDGTLVGVIPFLVRPYVIAPGLVLDVALANSVAVEDGHRGAGIGSRMMAAAREFLAAHADATFVYTGTEAGGPQYNFYRRTGYVDLIYPRRWRRPVAGGSAALGTPLADALEREAALARVYAACFGAVGGGPPREPGYWARAFASHIFVELPHEDFRAVFVERDGAPAAYALAGLHEGVCVVLEWAAVDAAGADELWPAVDRLARAWQAHEVMAHAQELTGPLWETLPGAGFAAEPRDDVLSGQVLRPAAVFAARWGLAHSGPPPRVRVWTPDGDVALGATDPEPDVLLEMKRETLHRLLLARDDLAALVRVQRVTVLRGDAGDVDALARALAPAPWAYHHLDYI